MIGGCLAEDAERVCSSDVDCRDGEACGTTTCSGFLRCIPRRCACNRMLVGPPGDACLRSPDPEANTPVCSCAHATCASPRDSCGRSTCPGVCALGESCAACLYNSCSQDVCRGSSCVVNDARTAAVCRPDECVEPRARKPPLCGTPDALCGEECCKPDCVGRVCGEDPRCGESCGAGCEPQHVCSSEGQCQLDKRVTACPGDLRTTTPRIAVERPSGSPPAPAGGSITDGIYDLVAARAYVENPPADLYERAAIRFSEGGTQVELVYDPHPDYPSNAGGLHRLMMVEMESSTEMLLVARCPSDDPISRYLRRGFTAQGSELWLFQPNVVEVYRARQ